MVNFGAASTTTASITFDGGVSNGYPTYSFAWVVTGSGTVNVTGNFTYADRCWGPVGDSTFAPVLNLTGQLIATWDTSQGQAPGNTSPSAMKFTANGNTFGGGINATFNMINVSGNNNTINGGITLMGTKFQDFYSAPGNEYSTGAGYLTFTGTGNTFGAQAVNLNQYGTLDFTQSANLTAITAINFNGGMLKLESTSNTFGALPGGFNVVSGGLWINTAASLGDPTRNAIQLGGPHSLGMLTGGTGYNPDWSWAAPLTQNITLNGEGGVIRVYPLQFSPAYEGLMSIASTISGSGALITTGAGSTWLMNGSSGPDTYSGGTIVTDGTLGVQSARSLGTGNVKIYGGGVLELQGANNVASGAKVQLSSTLGYNNEAVLRVDTDVMPTIDPTMVNGVPVYTNGVLQLENQWTWFQPGGAVATALGAGIAGDGTNGNLVLGGQLWGGFYGGSSLAPDEGNVYRLGSNASNEEAALFLQNQAVPGTSVLTGNNGVILNRGCVQNYDAASFTGTLTVINSIDMGQNGGNGATWGDRNSLGGFYGYQQAAGTTNSAFGAPTGNVVLEDGVIGLEFNGGTAPVVKNDLSYNGQGIIVLTGTSGNVTQLNLATLTRVGNSNLVIDPAGVLGTDDILMVAGGVPVDNIPGG
jgi:hypothetical protein